MSLEMPSYQRHWRIYLALVALAIVAVLVRSWQNSPPKEDSEPTQVENTGTALETGGEP